MKIETRENPKFSCEEKEKKEREKEIEERHRGRKGEWAESFRLHFFLLEMNYVLPNKGSYKSHSRLFVKNPPAAPIIIIIIILLIIIERKMKNAGK